MAALRLAALRECEGGSAGAPSCFERSEKQSWAAPRGTQGPEARGHRPRAANRARRASRASGSERKSRRGGAGDAASGASSPASRMLPGPSKGLAPEERGSPVPAADREGRRAVGRQRERRLSTALLWVLTRAPLGARARAAWSGPRWSRPGVQGSGMRSVPCPTLIDYSNAMSSGSS